jgi:hypothetical protein
MGRSCRTCRRAQTRVAQCGQPQSRTKSGPVLGAHAQDIRIARTSNAVSAATAVHVARASTDSVVRRFKADSMYDVSSSSEPQRGTDRARGGRCRHEGTIDVRLITVQRFTGTAQRAGPRPCLSRGLSRGGAEGVQCMSRTAAQGRLDGGSGFRP